MIRVLIADDEQMLRTALASLLDLEDDLAVIAQVDNGQAVLDDGIVGADVYVLDLEMPRLDGLDTAKALLARDPGTAIVMITRHARPGVLRAALAAGVRGFVPKYTPAEELASVIRQVHAGQRYVASELAVTALGFDCPLTDRELDVLRLTATGHTVQEIAQTLHLAGGTVRNYLSDAITKLGAANRHAAAREARERGWI